MGYDANAPKPGKRMLSSMTPTFMESKDKVAVLGTPGGSRIITMVLLGILGYDAGLDAQQVAALPRYHHQWMPDVIEAESGAFTPEVVKGLRAMGHTVKVPDEESEDDGRRSSHVWGNLQTVEWDKAGNTLSGGSDPRNSVGRPRSSCLRHDRHRQRIATMPDPDKKPFLHLLPAILTGAAALLASLTAVYVNVGHDKSAQPDKVEAPPATPATPAVAAASSTPRTLKLRLDRIAVQHDGSMGTTDWRFAVEVDGQPLFVFQQDDLDDTGGRNVVLPKDIGSDVDLAPGKPARIEVKAWRGSRLRLVEGEPDARGAGTLTGAGALAPLAVAAAKPEKGAFVLYFSAIAE